MKQHITIEQLNELSDKAKEKLREWWKPEVGDVYRCDGANCVISGSEKWPLVMGGPMYPLLSVGQMIELIDENDVGEWSIHNEAGDGWTINSNNLYAPQYYIPTGKDSGDICDCLWEAVKYILEKEE